jgi:hypothetical protein
VKSSLRCGIAAKNKLNQKWNIIFKFKFKRFFSQALSENAFDSPVADFIKSQRSLAGRSQALGQSFSIKGV